MVPNGTDFTPEGLKGKQANILTSLKKKRKPVGFWTLENKCHLIN